MADDNQQDYIAIDEALFVHQINNKKRIWLIGLINTNTKYLELK